MYSQPALFVTNLAALEVARLHHGVHLVGCKATAGLSLGEYCALVFAGAISFEDGLKVRVLGDFSMGRRGRPAWEHDKLPSLISFVVQS